MGLERPFDDDRWIEDHTGHAACFLCGRKVDPLDARRGTYTPNAKACESALVIHLDCAEPYVRRGQDGQMELHGIACTALREMGEYMIRQSLKAARVAVTSPLGT